MSLGHCIVEYVSPKHPIKIKLTINSIISFLKAGKCVGETISSPEHSYVNVWGRGNLLKMNEDVIAIFSVAQGISCHQQINYKINLCPVIFSALMENCTVLKSSDKVRQSSPDNIKKM